MKCLCCKKREIAKSGRGYKLLLCPRCDLALDIAGSDEGREIQKNRALMVAMNYFEYWRDHLDEVEAPPWGMEYLRWQEEQRKVAEELREVEEKKAELERRKALQKARSRRYYLAHREQVLARTGAYEKAHREMYREIQRNWRNRNAGSIQRDRERCKEWWHARGKFLREARREEWDTPEHREKARERARRYRETHLEQVREKNREYQRRRKEARKNA